MNTIIQLLQQLCQWGRNKLSQKKSSLLEFDRKEESESRSSKKTHLTIDLKVLTIVVMVLAILDYIIRSLVGNQ